MQRRVFVGFGFGAIQGGLFLYEAHRSGNFQRLVVAEVVPEVVARVRGNGGKYKVNVATATGLEVHEVTGVEIFNPNVLADRAELVRAIREACEICTALPSVDFFGSVAPVLADGLRGKEVPAVVYTAENNNHAAEFLEKAVGPVAAPVQFLNTVIGKMSGVIPGSRELLVEEFNRILITKITLPGFKRGIEVFSEKPDLLPFEEAKLYGHNAVHALLGYLANEKGLEFMSDIDGELLELGRQAFLQESGPALIARHAGVDPLFTPAGYRAYAEDLLPRMVNPWLKDAVARIIRDPQRKLAWNDRLIGTMRLALDAGIQPVRFARGAAAAVKLLTVPCESLWPEPDQPAGRKAALRQLIGG
ncbi:MAG: Mannitol-1-phosphate 5-dehydrogenase [Verrucomicrobiae bacterium]|nr:Mannitol-1-phosphate 5-dehydrogenase [Verrucomicrobiae bacterium]